MLVLTRKVNEQIRISQQIVIKVIRFLGGKVKLGIEYPHKIRVCRNEVPLEILEVETVSPREVYTIFKS